jgi:hypothetical protein
LRSKKKLVKPRHTFHIARHGNVENSQLTNPTSFTAMPRTKLKPHSEDYKQVSELLHSVSWGSTCYLVYPLDGTLCCLLVPCQLGSYVLVPCHWQQWEERKDTILKIATLLQVKPGAIMYGDCTDYDCDRLNFELAKSGIVTYWNGASNKLNQSQFILRGLDGIDIFNPAKWKR